MAAPLTAFKGSRKNKFDSIVLFPNPRKIRSKEANHSNWDTAIFATVLTTLFYDTLIAVMRRLRDSCDMIWQSGAVLLWGARVLRVPQQQDVRHSV